MNEYQKEILTSYHVEIEELLKDINVGEDGEHLWENYQKVTATAFRLSEMHNEISMMEITGEDWPEIKKLRTLIIDPTIERLEKVAAFESRKITGKQMELTLDR
jgi:hypothetical protein